MSVMTSAEKLSASADDSAVIANQHRRVLIVDDDSFMREWIDRALRTAGYRTSRAVDGQDALEIADLYGPFDLLLTDVVMPRMSGTALAQRLRRTDPRLKVLYLTGYVDRLFGQRVVLNEEEAFLEKPSSFEGLLEAVSLLLDGHVERGPETGLGRA